MNGVKKMKQLIVPIIFYIAAVVFYTLTLVTRKGIFILLGSALLVIGAIFMFLNLHKKK